MSSMSAVELRRNLSPLFSQQMQIEKPVCDSPPVPFRGVEQWNASVARVDQALSHLVARPGDLKPALEEQNSAEQILLRKVGDVYSQLPVGSDHHLRDRLSQDLLASVPTLVSDRDILKMISNTLVDIKENYQKIFAGATSKYADFFKDFSETITKLSGHLKADGTNDMTVDVNALQNDLLAVISKHKNVALVSCDTEQEAKYWAKELGLASDIDIAGDARPAYITMTDGKWCVYPNLEPLVQIIVASNYKDNGDKEPLSISPRYGKAGDPAYTKISGDWAWSNGAKLNNAVFQAWQTAHSTQKEQVQSTVQVLAEKFGRANSVYDNIVKVLSGITAALEEAEKSALRL